jgi:hypothetical protein
VKSRNNPQRQHGPDSRAIDGQTNNRSTVPGDDPWQQTTVARTLRPPQPGTCQWRDRFGDSLVCVRYRHDARSAHRYTTVELLVDHAAVRVVRNCRKAWELRVTPIKTAIRRALRKAGVAWDPEAEAWRLSFTLAKRLGLVGTVLPAEKRAGVNTGQ